MFRNHPRGHRSNRACPAPISSSGWTASEPRRKRNRKPTATRPSRASRRSTGTAICADADADADADPLRKHGPARETHPAEWTAAMREARAAGVEVITRDGAMAYGPAPSPGRPGQMIIDPDASYGALLHEMSHLRDDRDAGWPGMAGAIGDPRTRYENEVRAYQKEIDYARSIGDTESVDKLHGLLREEYENIFGVAP